MASVRQPEGGSLAKDPRTKLVGFDDYEVWFGCRGLRGFSGGGLDRGAGDPQATLVDVDLGAKNCLRFTKGSQVEYEQTSVINDCYRENIDVYTLYKERIASSNKL